MSTQNNNKLILTVSLLVCVTVIIVALILRPKNNEGFIKKEKSNSNTAEVPKKQEEQEPYTSPFFDYEVEEDHVFITIKDGKAPYTVSLSKNDVRVFTQEYKEEGIFKIVIDEYREDPGIYSLIFNDTKGKIKVKDINIRAKDYVEDVEGNRYKIINIEERIWLAQNLKYNVVGSKCDDVRYRQSNLEPCDLGREYTLALAKRACKSLGNNWRLPTNKEFAALFLYFGGYQNTINGGKRVIGSPKEAYNAACNPENGFNAFDRDMYWTSDEHIYRIYDVMNDEYKSEMLPIVYYINTYEEAIEATQIDFSDYINCRCIKN